MDRISPQAYDEVRQDITDGWDTAPRPIPAELELRPLPIHKIVAIGNIAFMGDFNQPPKPSD